jgi:hypothetical protein
MNDKKWDDWNIKLPAWAVLLIGLTCWPAALLAEEEHTFSMTDRNGKLTITMKPCPLGEWFKDWRAASWIFRGQQFEGCWTWQQRTIIVIDSAGAVSTHSPETFQKDTPI